MLPNLADHFSEMNRLRGRLRHLLDDTFAQVAPEPALVQWSPPADITATPEGAVVTLELCGVSREEVDVSLHGSVLTVSGRREREMDPWAEYLQLERPAGAFSRSFALSYAPQSVEATLSDGMLTVVLTR
jgi:HSP20 family protein